MVMTWLARMLEMEAALKTQAKKFHHPANQLRLLPHRGPPVTDAQWYTPALDGMALESSAKQAAIIQ